MCFTVMLKVSKIFGIMYSAVFLFVRLFVLEARRTSFSEMYQYDLTDGFIPRARF